MFVEAPHDNGAPDVIQLPQSQSKKDLVHRALSTLHKTVGHCGNNPLCAILKQAHAQDWIVQQARNFQCGVCKTVVARQPTPESSAEMPSPLDVVSIDNGCEAAVESERQLQERLAKFEEEKHQWNKTREAEIASLSTAGDELAKAWAQLETERRQFLDSKTSY